MNNEDRFFVQDWRNTLHQIIFEADTPAGKLFDVVLLWAIVLSILAVMLETVDSIREKYEATLRVVEWTFTVLFTIEYITRILSVHKRLKYIFSFYGLVDFFSIIPTYLAFFFASAQYFIVIRSLRLLRVFRVLKLARYLGESEVLLEAMRQSRPKITVFLGVVFTVVVMMGSLMYVVEGADSGFTSIPKSMYWAIVTLTTVGYGNIAPQTPLGQIFSAALMILGYGIIAVPTGIVTAEMTKATVAEGVSTLSCRSCASEGHDKDAKHCKYCGHTL